MTLLNIITYPNKRLTDKAKGVDVIDDHIKRFCDDLSETMLKRDGVGLAATQVGALVNIFVLNDGGPKVFINPRNSVLSTERVEEIEGCLSFPEIFVKIERSAAAKVTATDIDGNEFTYAKDGLLGRAIQHEMDHLHGVTMIDHVGHLKKQMILKKLSKRNK